MYALHNVFAVALLVFFGSIMCPCKFYMVFYRVLLLKDFGFHNALI